MSAGLVFGVDCGYSRQVMDATTAQPCGGLAAVPMQIGVGSVTGVVVHRVSGIVVSLQVQETGDLEVDRIPIYCHLIGSPREEASVVFMISSC